jgi:hypothetical protein
MIITKQEIRSLEELVQKGDAHTGFWGENPHLLLSTPYFDDHVHYEHGCYTGVPGWPKHFGLLENWIHTTPNDFFKKPGGQWLWLLRSKEKISFHSSSSWRMKTNLNELYENIYFELEFDKLVEHLKKIYANPIEDSKSIISPLLWTPEAQKEERIILRDTTSELLSAVIKEKLSLRKIHWKQFEEIVAEVLRASGLEIHLVRENPQGGRDIIARGEIISGLGPMCLAVEVKQRETVYRPTIQKAIYQNRYFPALLFVTSGRFSSGVFKEKRLPENQLRLILKDGVAIRDMINAYGLK